MEITNMVVRGDRIIVTAPKEDLNHILSRASLALTPLEPMKGIERGTNGLAWLGNDLVIAGKENIHQFIDGLMGFAGWEENFWAEAYSVRSS